ncbi:MAG: WYL domain-containing protein [Thermodesulfobacteriales bacterium]|nr:MAG: WYL domain-containing protein [Thermodesulfobacteriales bacterium]
MNIDLSEQLSEKTLTTLALHRVKAVRLLDEKFDYPYELDLKNEFKSNSFNFADEVHNIRLKFPARTREYILEREWYPNQTSKVQKDGSPILEFESDLNLIVQGWIRGFGPDVEVLEPLVLRKKIIEDLKTNLNQY